MTTLTHEELKQQDNSQHDPVPAPMPVNKLKQLLDSPYSMVKQLVLSSVGLAARAQLQHLLQQASVAKPVKKAFRHSKGYQHVHTPEPDLTPATSATTSNNLLDTVQGLIGQRQALTLRLTRTNSAMNKLLLEQLAKQYGFQLDKENFSQWLNKGFKPEALQTFREQLTASNVALPTYLQAATSMLVWPALVMLNKAFVLSTFLAENNVQPTERNQFIANTLNSNPMQNLHQQLQKDWQQLQAVQQQLANLQQQSPSVQPQPKATPIPRPTPNSNNARSKLLDKMMRPRPGR